MIDPAYTIAGAVAGFVVGLTGVGGGALMTPILLYGFGVSPVTAVATDLWFAALTKLAGAAIHHRAGQVDWQVVRRLWAGSIPMAALVVLAVSMGAGVARLHWLSQLIGVVLLITAIGMLAAPWLSARARARRLDQPAQFKASQRALTIGAGATLGLCVALTSVGAGALGTVALRYLYPLRMTPHRLVATDLLHAIPLAAVAGTGYLVAGMVDGHMLVSMLAGSVPAIVVGSLLARRIASRWMQVGLAIALAASSLKAFV
jgi:uncharacterized membrane protein YfcA